MTESFELARLCRAVGSDLLMVQGGGGNGSVKSESGERMWIKASGFKMSDVSPDAGYAQIDTAGMVAVVRDPELAAMPAQAAHVECVRRTNELGGSGPRPSMETAFHALLGRVVLHTHCVPINAFACSADGRRLLEAEIDEPFMWMPYLTPGYVLSRKMDRLLAERGQVGAIVLANHGFIASAESVEEALQITERFVAAAVRAFGPLPNPVAENPDDTVAAWASELREALRAAGSGLDVSASTAEIVRRSSAQHGLTGCLIPDEAIYTGLNVEVCDIDSRATDWLAKSGFANRDRFVAVAPGRGAWFAGPAKSLSATEQSVVASAVLREMIGRRSEATWIAERECRYLLSMESEKYRQAVSAGTAGGQSV